MLTEPFLSCLTPRSSIPHRSITAARSAVGPGVGKRIGAWPPAWTALAIQLRETQYPGMTDPTPEAATSGWTGGCQCGAVRYRIDAKPHVSVCHCRMCQKASGGPFVVLAAVPGHTVTWTRGTAARFRSSDVAERWFCSACGTPLAYADLQDGGLELMVGSLDAPARAVPVGAAGLESYIAWVDKVPGLKGRSTETIVAAANKRQPTSYQHPDHDTPEGWSPRAPATGKS
ncbi:GFA family protein [Pyxidicoccus sp. 3LFB2]